jgi:hypothetical protein
LFTLIETLPDDEIDCWGRNLGTRSRSFSSIYFEELIVRGYLMTEIVELGGSGTLAIVTASRCR